MARISRYESRFLVCHPCECLERVLPHSNVSYMLDHSERVPTQLNSEFQCTLLTNHRSSSSKPPLHYYYSYYYYLVLLPFTQ